MYKLDDGPVEWGMNHEIYNMLKEFDRLGLPIPARLQDALEDRKFDRGSLTTFAGRLINEWARSGKEDISRLTASDPSVGKMANVFMDDESLDDER